MLDTIRAHFPDEVTFTDPQGGLFTWLTFPEAFDTEVFMRDHALPEAKVAYVPGRNVLPAERRAEPRPRELLDANRRTHRRRHLETRRSAQIRDGRLTRLAV